MVIDDGVSTNEAIPPLVSIVRGKVNLGRVSLEQWRDIVLSGSSRFNHYINLNSSYLEQSLSVFAVIVCRCPIKYHPTRFNRSLI